MVDVMGRKFKPYDPDEGEEWESYPPDCKCGAPWWETKFHPPDGIGYCEVCGRNTEEA